MLLILEPNKKNTNKRLKNRLMYLEPEINNQVISAGATDSS